MVTTIVELKTGNNNKHKKTIWCNCTLNKKSFLFESICKRSGILCTVMLWNTILSAWKWPGLCCQNENFWCQINTESPCTKRSNAEPNTYIQSLPMLYMYRTWLSFSLFYPSSFQTDINNKTGKSLNWAPISFNKSAPIKEWNAPSPTKNKCYRYQQS